MAVQSSLVQSGGQGAETNFSAHQSAPPFDVAAINHSTDSVATSSDPLETVDPTTKPIFWEIFAGCSKLSYCMQLANFQAVPVDHDDNEHLSCLPQLLLDLRDVEAQHFLLQKFHSERPVCIHVAMPCGTGSRARDKPVAAALKNRGAPEPPPLRSAAFPLGIPGLSHYHQAKVASANRLLEFVVALLHLCYTSHVHIVLENPSRSWIWAAITALVLRMADPDFHRWYNALTDFTFHACEHGGTRPKETRFLTTVKTLLHLERSCSKKHQHAPFGIFWDGKRWSFDTSKEAEYPTLLCTRYTQLLCRQLKLPFPTTLSSRAESDLAQLRQPRTFQALVPEYYKVVTMSDEQVQNLKQPHKVLECLNSQGTGQETMKRVGIYHSMEQFCKKAMSLKHPMGTHNAVSDEVKQAIFHVFSKGFNETAKERIMAISKVAKMRQELEVEEKRFKATLPPHVQEVLGSKPLLLWRELLQQTGFEDMDVFNLMQGVALTGVPSKSPLFDSKVVLAKTSKEFFVESSAWRNKSLIAKVAHADEPELMKTLWDETMKEVNRGFIEGPFASLEEVKTFLATDKVCVTRRFVILQSSGAEVKPRVIDDAKESGLNSAYTALEWLKLHDFDHIASIASLISSIYGGDGSIGIAGPDGKTVKSDIHSDLKKFPSWVRRCLDLSKAYKQVPIDADSRALIVLMVPSPESKQAMFFTTASMPFGCASSVFAFNRITRSILHLFHKLLNLVSGVFYHDFVLLEPQHTSTLASMAAENLLDALGWAFAKEGSKASGFNASFNLLGAQLNLSWLAEGRIEVSNKEGRVDKLLKLLEDVSDAGSISRHMAQSIQGLLNYASGFFLGNSLKLPSRAFANIISKPSCASREDLKKLCSFTSSILKQSKPRTWGCWESGEPVIVFTDGSFEDDRGLWGSVVIDMQSGNKSVHWGEVPERLISVWKKLAGEQVICQIEAFAVLLTRYHYRNIWEGRKVLIFIDNEPSRHTLIKGSSPSISMLLIAQAFNEVDVNFPAACWFDRVPSASNIADLPSRGKQIEAAKMIGATLEGDITLPDVFISKLCDSQGIPLRIFSSTSD